MDLGRWALNNLAFLTYRAGEPMLLCVRGPSISDDGAVWLESAQLVDGQVGAGVRTQRKTDPEEAPRGQEAIRPYGTRQLRARDYKFGVRFVRYEVDGDQEFDDRDRPPGGGARSKTMSSSQPSRERS